MVLAALQQRQRVQAVFLGLLVLLAQTVHLVLQQHLLVLQVYLRLQVLMVQMVHQVLQELQQV